MKAKTDKVKLDWEAKNYKWLMLREIKKLKLLPGFDEVLKRLTKYKFILLSLNEHLKIYYNSIIILYLFIMISFLPVMYHEYNKLGIYKNIFLI